MAPSATRPKNPSPLHRNLRKPTTSKPSWNQLFEERQDEDEDANDYDSSDDESAEDWDEGRTLIDSLKIIEKSDDSLENALARVETLEGPMAAQSKKLQQDLIDVLVPAMDHIRLIHGLIEDSVEAKYTSAILEFDQAADMYQSNASDARTEMLEMLETSKKTLREQLHIIRTEYAKREKLQDDLQTAVKAIALPARAHLNECGRELDHLRATLEKKSKTLAKSDKGAKSHEMLLKGLMAKK